MSNANYAGLEADLSAQLPPVRSHSLSPWRIAYGIYAWLQFLLMALAGMPVLLLTPGVQRRRAVVRALARSALWLAGMRLQVRGLDELQMPCVLVANHCSYIDGVVLTAALPAGFSYVIKREMSRVPLAGTLLRRIGAQFVERRDRKLAVRDTRRLLRAAGSGQALAFFPEGTFGKEVGLLRFHIGAFAAAARAGLPVVPVAIRGTRHCLPADCIWPRPGLIQVDALAAVPIPGANQGCDVAAYLRDSARERLLRVLDEPDLAPRKA